MSGSAAVSANLVGVVGDISGASNITATNGMRTHVSRSPIPTQTYIRPQSRAAPTKDSGERQWETNTLDPGCYSGSITVNAGATLNLNPGIYYLDGANLNVAGNATITGTGVTLVFTGSGSEWGTASIGSNANVTLTAPSFRTDPRHRCLWRPQYAGGHRF